MESIFFSASDIVRFAIVLFRVAGIMAFAPIFSSGAINFRVKITFTLMVALLLASSLSSVQIPTEFGLGQVAVSIFSESLIGLILGLVASFIFAGLQLAGKIISFHLGFSIINVIDPESEVETTVISILQNFIGLMLFLLMNGHHWFFLAVSQSFDYLPVGGAQLTGPVVHEIVRLSSKIFVSGVQIAAPIMAVTIVTDVILGIIGRSSPQINVLIVGMPVKTLVGFTVMSISFYFMPRLLGGYFSQLFGDFFNLLYRLG